MFVKRISFCVLALSALLVAMAVPAPAAVIGWGDPGHSSSGDWVNIGSGWSDGIRIESLEDTANTSTWTFTGLDNGDYYIAASWSPWANRTTLAQYDISDTGGSLGSYVVSQQTPWRGFNAEGFGWWNSLNDLAIPVTDGTLTVTLSDTDLVGFMMADAIQISTDLMGDPNVFVIDSNSPSGYSTTGGWGPIQENPGNPSVFTGDSWYQTTGAGADTASWSFSGLPAGDYRVSTTWVTHANRSTDAQFDLTDGGGSVHVDQRVLTADVNDGNPWQDLNKEVWIGDGTFDVNLSDNDAAGFLMHDAVRLELLPAMLVWDALGDGNWGDDDLIPPGWNLNDGSPAGAYPTSENRVRIPGNTVTVTGVQAAIILQITGGGLALANDASLTLAETIDAPAGTVSLGNNSSLSLGQGGSISSLSTTGDATVITAASLAVGTLTVGPGILTKQGVGMLALQSIVGDPASALRVEQGSVKANGADPLGGITDVQLAGGMLSLSPGGQAVAYWSFDNPLNLGADDSGNGHDASEVGAPLPNALGISGGAVQFDGFSQLWVDDQDDLRTFPDGLTVSFWANDSTGTGGPMLSRWGDDTTGYGADGWAWYFSDGVEYGTVPTSVPVDSQWHHYVMTWDPYDNDRVVSYRDGVPIGETNKALAFSPVAGLAIGTDNRNLPWAFIGSVDEAFIHSAALDAGEVAALYAAPGSMPTDGDPLDPVKMAATQITVSADSILQISNPVGVSLGSLTMEQGILSTTGSASVTFDGTTVPLGTTGLIGFDPHVPTDYGTININNSDVTIAKGGSSAWTIDNTNRPINLGAGADWEVQGGTLKLEGADTLFGRPMTVSGGELFLADTAALGASPLTLAGGALVIEGAAGPPAGAAAYYSFSHAGNPGYDDTDNGHQGNLQQDPITLTDATRWSTGGLIGGGLEQDLPYGGMVTFPDTPVGEDWTMSIWANDIAGSGWRSLFGDGTSQDHHVLVDPAGQLGVWLIDRAYEDPPLDPFISSGFDMNTLDLDVWHHIVAVGTGATTEFYIDGVSVATAAGKSAHPIGTIGNYAAGSGQAFAELVDEAVIYDRVIDPAEIAALYDAGIAGTYGGAATDLSGLNFAVTADSAISTSAPGLQLGTATLQSGVLALAAGGDIQLAGTIIDPTGVEPYLVGIEAGRSVQLGQIDVLNTVDPITFAKRGPGDLVLTGANLGINGLPANVTLDSQEGTLVGVHGSNPFDQAAVKLSGGNLTLASDASDTTVQFDNAVTVEADATISAGPSATATTNVVAQLGGSNGVSVTAGTLNLTSEPGYQLDIAGPLSVDTTLAVESGDVTLSGGGSATTLSVAGGTLRGGDGLTVDNMYVSNGVVDTQGGQVTIVNSLNLENTSFTPEAGFPIRVEGADLLSETVDRTITIAGGTLVVKKSTMPDGAIGAWSFDEGTGTTEPDRSSGGNPANLVGGATWVTDDPDRGTVVSLDGSSGLIDVPGFSTTLDAITFAGWFKGHQASPFAGLFTSRGSSQLFFGLDGTTADNTALAWNNNANWWPGAPQLPTDQWSFAAVSIAPDAATISVYSGGVWDIQTNPLATGAMALVGLEIGHDMTYDDGTRHFQGLVDDSFVFNRALSAEELAGLMASAGGPLDLAHTNLNVTETSILAPNTQGDAVFGDLTVADGVQLTLQDAPALSVYDLNLGDGAQLGSVADPEHPQPIVVVVRGMIDVGSSPGTATIVGELEMDEGDSGNTEAGLHVDISGDLNDKLVMDGSSLIEGASGIAWIAGTLEVEGQKPMTSVGNPIWGDQVLTVMQATPAVEEDGGFKGDFGPSSPGGSIPLSYGTAGTLPNEGDYLGAGMWFGNAGDDGVYYVNRVVADGPATAVDIGVFQAAPGDTDGNRKVEGQDILNILQAGLFGDGVTTEANWGNGDFNSDSKISGEDILALLGTGLFGDGTYPDSAAAAAAADVKLVVTGGGLVIDAGDATITGFVLSSKSGILTGDDADNLGLFQEDTDATISGTFAMSFGGEHSLGDVIGDADVDLGGDLSLAYTIAGVPGVFTASVVVPEPGTLVLLLGGLIGLLIWRRRRVV